MTDARTIYRYCRASARAHARMSELFREPQQAGSGQDATLARLLRVEHLAWLNLSDTLRAQLHSPYHHKGV